MPEKADSVVWRLCIINGQEIVSKLRVTRRIENRPLAADRRIECDWLVHDDAQRGAKGRRAFAASLLSVKLDTNTATERCQQNGEKPPHDKTDDAWCKSERNKEERKTPKHKTRERSRTGNTSNSTNKLDATKIELTTKPATKKQPTRQKKLA